MVALLSRYHRKRPPRDDDEAFTDLSAQDRDKINILLPLIIAAALVSMVFLLAYWRVRRRGWDKKARKK